jgi:hypothetical protein
MRKRWQRRARCWNLWTDWRLGARPCQATKLGSNYDANDRSWPNSDIREWLLSTQSDLRAARKRTLRLAATFKSNGRVDPHLRSFKFPESGTFPQPGSERSAPYGRGAAAGTPSLGRVAGRRAAQAGPAFVICPGLRKHPRPQRRHWVCEKSKALSRLFAAASRLPRGANCQRVSMSFRIETVS